MKDGIRMARAPLISDNIVIVDGITRAGKFWLGALLQHLERVEPLLCVPSMDMFIYLNRLGMISDNAALGLLQDEANTHMLNAYSGRNLNLRLADSSSILKSPNLEVYLRRILASDTAPGERSRGVRRSRAVFPFIGHDWLCNASLCFRAFPRLRAVRIERNPVDLVYAWHKKGHGNRRAFSGGIEGVRGPVPWFVHSWMDEYERMSEMDRIIRSIASLTEMAEASLRGLPKKFARRILFTSYERLGDRFSREAGRIGAFLGTKRRGSFPDFAAREALKQRDKAALDRARAKKRAEIKLKASARCFSLLRDLEKRY